MLVGYPLVQDIVGRKEGGVWGGCGFGGRFRRLVNFSGLRFFGFATRVLVVRMWSCAL